MKPLWTQTLVWLAAVVAAFLLAAAGPDWLGFATDVRASQGAGMPR